MSIKKAKQLAINNGLPKDYCLSGNKKQQFQQILHFFKYVLNWNSIAGLKSNPKDKAKWLWAKRTFV